MSKLAKIRQKQRRAWIGKLASAKASQLRVKARRAKARAEARARARFTVTITTIAGEQRELRVCGSYLVRAVLADISRVDGVPVERLCLCFGLLLLENLRTLSDYNIQKGVWLTLVRNTQPLTYHCRLRGREGMPDSFWEAVRHWREVLRAETLPAGFSASDLEKPGSYDPS